MQTSSPQIIILDIFFRFGSNWQLTLEHFALKSNEYFPRFSNKFISSKLLKRVRANSQNWDPAKPNEIWVSRLDFTPNKLSLIKTFFVVSSQKGYFFCKSRTQNFTELIITINILAFKIIDNWNFRMLFVFLTCSKILVSEAIINHFGRTFPSND